MKRFFLGLLCLCLAVGTVSAQDGKKMLKKAVKASSKYNSNVAKNGASLTEALGFIESASQDPFASTAQGLNMIGKAYTNIIEGEWKSSLLGGNGMTTLDAASKAYAAYKKALEVADKKKYKKAALKGIQTSEAYLNNVGAKYFEDKDYGTAFDYFNMGVDAYKLLSSNDEKSRLDDVAARDEHYFITAASGYYGDKKSASKPLFVELFDKGTNKALVYEALFNIGSEEGEDNAIAYLEKGRELFPEDSGLLFAEINYYLKLGKLDELTSKLKSAIEKEPNNPSIYLTLGNVYDQLSQKEREASNVDKATEYFDEAMGYYGKTLEIDPDNFDAVYSQGALYYNKAAGMTEKINELANDFTPAGTKKYDAMKAEMDGYFKQALPYFQKSESMNGNDLNTLIALREIYARTNQLDKVGDLKKRIETIQAGGGE